MFLPKHGSKEELSRKGEDDEDILVKHEEQDQVDGGETKKDTLIQSGDILRDSGSSESYRSDNEEEEEEGPKVLPGNIKTDMISLAIQFQQNVVVGTEKRFHGLKKHKSVFVGASVLSQRMRIRVNMLTQQARRPSIGW